MHLQVRTTATYAMHTTHTIIMVALQMLMPLMHVIFLYPTTWNSVRFGLHYIDWSYSNGHLYALLKGSQPTIMTPIKTLYHFYTRSAYQANGLFINPLSPSNSPSLSVSSSDIIFIDMFCLTNLYEFLSTSFFS